MLTFSKGKVAESIAAVNVCYWYTKPFAVSELERLSNAVVHAMHARQNTNATHTHQHIQPSQAKEYFYDCKIVNRGVS